MSPRLFKLLVNLWPPLMGAGIRIQSISPDFRDISVALKLRWFNRNYVGSHFGGSLFAMTDPFYMLILMRVLGKDYYVWDKDATIEFVAPGRGTVRADFSVTDAMLEDIRARTATGDKYLPQFRVPVMDEQGELVATVIKTLYIRRKPAAR